MNVRRRLMLCLAAAVTATPALAEDPHHPTVIEIFQSQGCSSCPPANANVMALSYRPDVLMLSFAVTYWDYLGWKDTFGSPQFTARQWDYAHAFDRGEVFTPEVVVDGRADVVGVEKGEIEALMAKLGRAAPGPDVRIEAGKAMIGAGAANAANVWLVRYDPRVLQVPIGRGENAGVTLPHKNVVRELVKLGDWNGKAESFALPAATHPGLNQAILVQSRGAILGVYTE